jgi:hypothetical protein
MAVWRGLAAAVAVVWGLWCGTALEAAGVDHVRFYTHSGPVFDWLANCSGPALLHWKSVYKYSDDVWFAEAALSDHPWRVTDPAQADIFLVPVLLAFGLRHRSGCQGVSTEAMFTRALDALHASPAWQRNQGRDHLFISTDFYSRHFLPPIGKELLANSIVGHMEHMR